MNRRHFLSTSLLLSAGSIFGTPSMGWAASDNGWRMPDESESHARTWMAFGASTAIWGKKLLPEVRRNLATIATTIARHRPMARPDSRVAWHRSMSWRRELKRLSPMTKKRNSHLNEK